jgi:signal transduction histidine kinase
MGYMPNFIDGASAFGDVLIVRVEEVVVSLAVLSFLCRPPSPPATLTMSLHPGGAAMAPTDRDAGAPDLRVMADPILLQVVLSNLIDTVINYSLMGGTIRVNARRRGTEVVIDAQGQGIGIAPEQAEQVFERNLRASHDNGVPSFGLGLFLVRPIAAMHGGEAKLQSVPGRGSVVSVHLPIADGLDYVAPPPGNWQ